MPVVGTAGHVDHGKSSLILALTGRDPDRWEEEKRRGLTIDLGFAWATLPGGTEVSFVDVPGHERFIKNMLAGVEAIDAALLVVAADEGWAAQSEEHLAVLDLLDVRRGVIALTKVDRVDADTAELARWEVSDKLAGTTLEAAPLVNVSAHSGEGLAQLVDLLEETVSGHELDRGRPRMWIDRSFSIAGAGTVVTGTLLGGELKVGMTVGIWRGGDVEEARIRSLESHENKVNRAPPHRRVAMNLVGIERGEVPRGSMLGIPANFQTTSRFLARFRTPRYIDQLSPRGAFQLHLGSGAWPVRWRQIDEGVAVCDLTTPLPLVVGDRFILRDTGRRAVVGGGQVIDPHPPRKGALLRTAASFLISHSSADPDTIAQALLTVRRSAASTVLAAHSGGGRPPQAVTAGDLLVHPDEAERLSAEIRMAVAAFHEATPLRPGLPATQLAARLGTVTGVVEALVQADAHLTLNQGLVANTGHQIAQPPTTDPRWLEAKAKLGAAGREIPRIADLALDRELFHALVRAGELVKISDDLAYLPEQVDDLLTVVAGLPEGFTVSDFREAAGFSRKYAVPFLEWTDANHKTLRQGDRRSFRK